MSLQKLLVREKAGQESRGIYLISSNPADPEMFELKVHKPKDKQVWIQAIRYDYIIVYYNTSAVGTSLPHERVMFIKRVEVDFGKSRECGKDAYRTRI